MITHAWASWKLERFVPVVPSHFTVVTCFSTQLEADGCVQVTVFIVAGLLISFESGWCAFFEGIA